MANPWDSNYKNGSSNKGAANGRIAVAVLKETSPPAVYWRHDTGSGTWSTPVPVGTVPDGSSQVFNTHYDGVYVWVENGIDVGWRSADYGAAGSWEAF